MKNILTIPKRIKEGDTVGLISPSAGLAPFAMHRIERAKKTIGKLGFKVKIAKNALKNSGYVSGSIQERVEDIHEMFMDRSVKLIIATIGGHHSNQLLQYIDYDLIKRNPKIFIGYSDMTVLHFAFYSKAKLQTYFGPCAMTQFGEYPEILDYTLEHFMLALFRKMNSGFTEIKSSEYWTDEVLDWFKKKDLTRPRKLKKNTGYEWLQTGSVMGEIIGGTVPSINHLAGTEYWIDPRDKIYFLDIPEADNIYKGYALSHVDAYLADLDNLGLFKKIKGLIVGRPYRYTEYENDEFKKVILKYAGNKKCPILYNANIGHTDPIITIPYGSLVRLDSKVNSFAIAF